jgi:quinoprotein glucose dehydrogenase
VQGLPLTKPPYGMLSAINLDRGEIVFQVPHGDTPDNVRNHPLLRAMNLPKTGQAGTSGVGLMVTKTLVVMGTRNPAPGRQRGAMLRALTSALVWKRVPLDAAIQSGSPMTASTGGRHHRRRDQRWAASGEYPRPASAERSPPAGWGRAVTRGRGG